MCGLVGAIGAINKPIEAAFKNMLFFDVVRGVHSTGIVNMTPQKVPYSAKLAGDPHSLLSSDLGKDVMKYQSVGLMGHNRHATIGEVNTKNAHPFMHGNVIGMHNGTLRGWKQDLDDAKLFEVDSSCLIYNINKNGAEDTLGKVDGAFALTWYNKGDHTFSMIRNDERPLSYCLTADKRSLLYASEDWMILVAASRNNIRLLKDGIHDLKVGQLYTWELPKKEHKPLPKVHTRMLNLYTPPRYNQWYGGYGRHSGNRHSFPGMDRKEVDKIYDEREDLAADMDSLRGKKIHFILDRVIDPQYKGGCYSMEGAMTEHPYHTVRVYCSSSKDAVDMIDQTEIELVGTAKSMLMPYVRCHKNTLTLDEGHIFVDPDSVEIADTYEPKTGEVIQLNDHRVRGPDGEPLTEAEFDKLTEHGCASCQCNLWYGNGDVVWTHDKQPLCESCDEEIQDMAANSTLN
jgi:hypothetical protein